MHTALVKNGNLGNEAAGDGSATRRYITLPLRVWRDLEAESIS